MFQYRVGCIDKSVLVALDMRNVEHLLRSVLCVIKQPQCVS